MANKILQIDLQNDITPQVGTYDNTGSVTPSYARDSGVYSLKPAGTTPYYWFTPTAEVTDFDLCWEDYQANEQTSPQYRFTIGDSAGNNVLLSYRQHGNFYFGSVNIGNLAYQTWHKILIQVRKASATTSKITAYVNGRKVAEGTESVLITSAKIALLGKVPNSTYSQNAGQKIRCVTIYDRSYGSKGVNLDGIMTTVTGLVSKIKNALSAVAFSGSYNDLSDKPTISTVNDGTLTIQKNGTNVATFTANQSTAATANITVPTAVSELANDSGYLTSSSNLDASKLTSGTVDIARLPQGALERLVKVANEAARYALTTADVQLGDTVQQLDTGIMYVVTDIDHLDSAAGYTEYTAGTAASVPWSGVTGKPTFAAVATSGAYSDLTGTPALAAVATSGAYSDLTGTPTIPTVNNATLTIQQNGTDVQTFTANASANAIANIQCVDLSTAQTVAGVKTFSKIALKSSRIERGVLPSSNVTEDNELAILDINDRRILGVFNYYYTDGSGRTAFYAYNPNTTDYDNISIAFNFDNTNNQKSLIPVTNTLDLGSSAAQWNNAYIKSLTINGTAAGDILTHNASEFVPVTGTNALAGSIVPSTDNSYNLGDSTYGFKNIYTNKMYLKGSTIFNVADDNYICLGGASAQANGANLVLNGKDRSTSTGEFKLEARDGTNTQQLIGKPDGTLSWSGTTLRFTNTSDYAHIRQNATNYGLYIYAGHGWGDGATIALIGKTNNNNTGTFYINVANESQNKSMYLHPDGTWTWNGTACQITSDQRLKQQITEIDDKLLDAWEDVELSQFKYNDAVDQKGDNARLHTGYVVQQIDKACKSHGVDVSKYGLYCHEVYQEETREVEHDDGTKTTEVVRPANEHYSLRYTEALIVECAYLRKKNKELQEQLDKLSARLDKLECSAK